MQSNMAIEEVKREFQFYFDVNIGIQRCHALILPWVLEIGLKYKYKSLT